MSSAAVTHTHTVATRETPPLSHFLLLPSSSSFRRRSFARTRHVCIMCLEISDIGPRATDKKTVDDSPFPSAAAAAAASFYFSPSFSGASGCRTHFLSSLLSPRPRCLLCPSSCPCLHPIPVLESIFWSFVHSRVLEKRFILLGYLSRRGSRSHPGYWTTMRAAAAATTS